MGKKYRKDNVPLKGVMRLPVKGHYFAVYKRSYFIFKGCTANYKGIFP